MEFWKNRKLTYHQLTIVADIQQHPDLFLTGSLGCFHDPGIPAASDA